MVKRIASAAVGFMLLASCGALCQDLQSLPDAPSALVSTDPHTNDTHTLNEFVDEARAPLQTAEADVHAGEMRQGGLVADGAASRHGEDFDAQSQPAAIYPDPAPTREAQDRGALTQMHPHPNFDVTKITDPLRVAEIL